MEQGRREQVSRERDLALAARELSRVAEDLRRVVEITEVQREAAERQMAEIQDAVLQQAAYFQERLAEGRAPAPWSREELSEEQVAQLADEAVHQIRVEISQERVPVEKLPTPDPEEVQEWEGRREERRRREGYSDV